MPSIGEGPFIRSYLAEMMRVEREGLPFPGYAARPPSGQLMNQEWAHVAAEWWVWRPRCNSLLLPAHHPEWIRRQPQANQWATPRCPKIENAPPRLGLDPQEPAEHHELVRGNHHFRHGHAPGHAFYSHSHGSYQDEGCSEDSSDNC